MQRLSCFMPTRGFPQLALSAILFLMGQLSAFGGALPASEHSLSIPAEGDWVLDSPLRIEGRRIDLNGRLILDPGADLTLEAATLVIHSRYQGEFGIEIRPGGTLRILGSKITASAEGDWYLLGMDGADLEITDSELRGCQRLEMALANPVFQGQVILGGALVIAAGGRMTLQDLVLRINSRFEGENGIIVEPGGVLRIYGSEISAEGENRFYFTVEGSGFEMKGSRLHGCQGLDILGNGANIESNVLTGNREGINLHAAGALVIDNSIESNDDHGIYLIKAESCRISHNRIHQAGTVGFPIQMLASNNNEILGNDLVQTGVNGLLVLAGSDENLIEGNSLSGHGIGIDMDYACRANTIRQNTIDVTEAGIMLWGWNNRVEENAIRSEGEGLYLVNAYNTVVDDNTLFDLDNTNGIFLRHSSNNRITNNTIQAGKQLEYGTAGILLWSQCSRNLIQGNVVRGFQRGMTLFHGCDHNVITENSIQSIDREGFIFDASSGNLIFRNNTLTDVGLPSHDNAANTWDYEGPVPPLEPATPPVFANPLEGEILDEQVIEDREFALADLVVKEGASLLLKNCDITSGAERKEVVDSEYHLFGTGLTVKPGGTLIIDSCRIVHAEYGYGFQLNLLEGAIFEMRNSEMRGCGSEWWYGGIRIHTDRAVLENNLISGTNLVLFGTSGGRFVGNTILQSYCAFGIEDGSNLLITGNRIEHSVMAAIRGTGSNIRIENNTFSHLWREGILFWEGRGYLVRGNAISEMNSDLPAIELSGSSSAWIVRNTVSGCTFGIQTGEKAWAKGNHVDHCALGMRVSLNGAAIESNALSHCSTGILVDGSRHAVFGNRISECDVGLVNALGATGNTFYLNSFIANRRQVRNDHPDGNLWDDGSRGNYWSDYSGADADRDGIGDRPHEIQPGSLDRYPLMRPFSFAEPEISANGTRGILLCQSYRPVRITIGLDPGSLNGLRGDWWVGVLTPFPEPYNLLMLTQISGWQWAVHPFFQGPLAEMGATEILNMPLPAGAYIFFFVVDDVMNAQPEIRWWDSVEVKVE